MTRETVRRACRRGVSIFVTTAAALAGCTTSDAVRTSDIALARKDIPAHAYVDPQTVGSYPSSPQRIQAWIDADQQDSIRAHGWDIWQSITAAVNDSTPTWQTWYSGHELFDMTAQPTATARPRHIRLPLERAKQVNHSFLTQQLFRDGSIPVDTFERVFAFNRFSRSTASYIWQNTLNRGTTLFFLNALKGAQKATLAQREVLVSADSTDALSFVTKVVFQFIPSDKVSAIPYWHGYGSANTRTNVPGDTLHPPPRYWKQGVAIDPTGKLQPGDSVFMAPNDSVPQMWLKVVPLSSFYYVTVTAADSAHLTDFGSKNGDDLGFNSDTSGMAVDSSARPGNLGLMLAMHVTGKEIANWTWQSYWWTPFPNDSLGSDRPTSISSPWNNYVMTTAYSMLTTTGAPNISFNPYLETSLASTPGSVPVWTGVITNCMSCHRRAAVAWGPKAVNDTIHANVADYGPAAQVNPGDSTIFMVTIPRSKGTYPTLKTDFLWSVALRAGLFQTITVREAENLLAQAKADAAARGSAALKR